MSGMHKYHNPENPNWTPPSDRLTAEQWANAYRDVSVQKDKEIAFLKGEIEALRIERDKALSAWADHPGDHGC